MIRLHLSDDLAAGVEITPAADQAHYLVHVMRARAGDTLLLFNGRDGEWRARLVAADKRGCRLEVDARTRPQSLGPDLELVVALVKRARLETIVEKAVELGCRRICLAITRRTNADHARVERLQAIAVEAAEQTGRLDAPEVSAPERLDRLLDGWDGARRLMFCDEAGDDPQTEWGGPDGRARPALEALSLTSGAAEGSGSWAVLIGPEGGFDPDERARLRALPFVTPVTLGPRILRADTAAIAALALWQAALGDWGRTKA